MGRVEPFNFTINLKNIIENEFKQYGFITRKTILQRKRENFIDEISFQRSNFNVQGYPCQFYLELYTQPVERSCFSGIRLRYPFGLIPPDYYKEYLALPQEEKANVICSFGKDNISPIYKLRILGHWSYSTEGELIDTLKTARDVLLTKGFEYFNKVTDIIKNALDADELKRKILDLEAILNKIE